MAKKDSLGKGLDILFADSDYGFSSDVQNENNITISNRNIVIDGKGFTIDENNHSEVIDKIFAELTATVSKVKADAEAKSKEIIDKANEKSRVIVRQAMENSVELRTQNSIVMKNLKSISDMIDVILDKASQ